MKKIRIIDSTLRDGMHAMSHQFSLEDMGQIAAALDAAGIPAIEACHGEGLSGHSLQYGFARHSDEEYLRTVSRNVKNAEIAVLLIPGIATKDDLIMAQANNARIVRVATHVTEADIAVQHIGFAKSLGMEAIGFLMMAHMADEAAILRQAEIFQEAGADMVYVTDSAGAMTPPEVSSRIACLKEGLKVPVGFHGHNNLGLGIGNTLAAIEAGAVSVDATCKGLGAGAGNCQTEVLAAVLEKMACETGVDVFAAMDAADDVVLPRIKNPCVIDKNTLTIGYAGVYGSFLLHAKRAGEKFGVDTREILLELGRRKTVGGQEDLIIDVAYQLSGRKK